MKHLQGIPPMAGMMPAPKPAWLQGRDWYLAGHLLYVISFSICFLLVLFYKRLSPWFLRIVYAPFKYQQML